jgi:lysophospholipase L1-like esterase
LVEHAGYSDGSNNVARDEVYTILNKVLQEAFAQLKSEGVKNIYVLPKNEMGLGLESFVDGTHPSDLGMMEYAKGYEKYIRQIFHQPIGVTSTTIPVTQMREPGNYNWEKRHQKLLRINKTDPPKICFIGNSITHFWGGIPEGPHRNGGDTWDDYLEDLGVRNFGYGWDRVENVLWRVHHEELDGFEAEQIILMLGTNNLHLNSDAEIIEGLELVIDAIQHRQPKAKVSLIGIFPRKQEEQRVHELNLKISQLAGKMDVYYTDIGKELLNSANKIEDSYFSDGLHPNEKGYAILGPELKAYLLK